MVHELSFALVDGILYFLDSRHGDRKRVAVPKHLHQGILEENHNGPMAGHFFRQETVQVISASLVVARYVY